MILQLSPVELEAVSSYWYLKFATHWGGPFSYIEVLQMLKSRKINRNMKIRAGNSSSQSSDNWYLISDLIEFSVDFIAAFLKYYVPNGRTIYEIRKFIRINYNSNVLVVSQDKRVQTCLCTELSAGGANIKVPAEFIKEEQKLTIQFFYNSNIKLKSFNAKAKVLRLNEINFNPEKEISEVYSLEFNDLKAKHKKMLLNSTQFKIKNLAKYIKEEGKKVVGVLDLNNFFKKYPYLMLNP